ncbi:MAG: hypothetical protein JST10_16315, partial [Bacteroidetes bacterium]|nr:hypothetical protein [Bacteroidota bacterium]
IQNSVDNTTSNYNYDEIGNITKDELEGNKDMVWSIYGKLLMAKKISTGVKITYSYDASGNRISKQVGNSYEEWTVRDASGNIMATYIKDPNVNNGKLTTQGYEMYGSNAIGTWEKHRDVETEGANNNERVLIRGEQKIRFSNHLGNTMLVLSDIKRQIQSPEDPSQITGYTPEVINATDYSAYGENLIGREFSSEGIKFGFNGKLNDNDLGYQDYGMRLSSVKKRGFLSVDPLTAKFPFYSPYQFAGNMPIRYIDLDGAEPAEPGKEKGEIQTGTNGNNVAKSWEWNGKNWNEAQMEAIVIQSGLSNDEKQAINNSTTPFVDNDYYYTNGKNYSLRERDMTFWGLYKEFRDGKGPTNSVFNGNHPLTQKVRNDISEIDRLRYLIYSSHNGELKAGDSYTNFRPYKGRFLPWKDNPASAPQFVGTFSGDVYVSNDGKSLVFVISDSKSITSLFYRIASDHDRVTIPWNYEPSIFDDCLNCMGNTYQKYIWTEPIDQEWYKSQSRDAKGYLITQ